MDTSLQKYYEDLLDMFAHPGWKEFIDEVKETEANANNLDYIKDEQTFWQNKGKLEFIRKVLFFESAIKESYEELTNG